MIEIALLTEKDIGRWVWYKPSVGDREKGRLKSWNSERIFVVYKCNGEWKRFADFTGAPTNPKELEFIDHQAHCRASEGFVCACIQRSILITPEEEDLF